MSSIARTSPQLVFSSPPISRGRQLSSSPPLCQCQFWHLTLHLAPSPHPHGHARHQLLGRLTLFQPPHAEAGWSYFLLRFVLPHSLPRRLVFLASLWEVMRRHLRR